MLGGAGVWGGLGYSLITHSLASGTNGGTFTVGAWRTRPLNTLVDSGIGTTLVSNQFTLPAGTYNIRAFSMAVLVNTSQAKLYNITDSADVILGMTVLVNSPSIVCGQFTITKTTTFELQHQGSATQANNGFGNPGAFGTNEIYAQVEITKIG